jgi:hypothetical protein
MGIIFNFDSDLDFITDWFRDLHLQEPEPSLEEEEQPPPVYAFFARLEEVVGTGPRALSRHLNRYDRDVFIMIS